jgi:ketosteroid isomerase-like protein
MPGTGYSTEDIDSLRRQIDNLRKSLRLVEERMSEYVLPTDVPLHLVGQEREIKEKLADLEAELARAESPGVTPAPAEPEREAPPVPGIPKKIYRIGILVLFLMLVAGLAYVATLKFHQVGVARATQTAIAAAATRGIKQAEPTEPPMPTDLPSPTSTPTIASTSTPVPAPTSTSTPTPTPDFEATVVSLIATEREAVLTEDVDLIRAIFASDATRINAVTSQSWNAIQYYIGAFETEEHLEITHTNFDVTVAGDEAMVANDSCGLLVLTATGQESAYNCPQCDRWTFNRDADGRWWITGVTVSLLSTAPVHQYTFEDGTAGCWTVRFDEGELQGQMPAFTTETAYAGQGALRFAFDLGGVSTHRAQTIRYNMPFAGHASAYVYAPPGAPADLEAGFFAMELDRAPWNYHDADQMSRLAPGAWTQITWDVDTAGWAQPVHLFGIEVRRAGGGSYDGYVLIDDVSIKSR